MKRIIVEKSSSTIYYKKDAYHFYYTEPLSIKAVRFSDEEWESVLRDCSEMKSKYLPTAILDKEWFVRVFGSFIED